MFATRFPRRRADPPRRAGTLLNRLFGTKFDVMNENERRQTTKGESGRLAHDSGADSMTRNLDVQGRGNACAGDGR